MALVERARLTRAIVDSASRGVALLVAPAGFGKTAAVAAAFGDIGILVEDVEAQPTVGGIARSLITQVRSADQPALTQILSRPDGEERDAFLVDWLAARLRSVLAPIIIDDFQRHDADPAVRNFVQTLIERTNPEVRWIICSREVPQLPIGGWIARDRMSLPILSGDLAFTAAEAAELARDLNVSISDEDIATIVADSEGWPLIVRLALEGWERTRAVVPLRIRTNAVLFDYLESQVWSTLDFADRRLLLATAVLTDVLPTVLRHAGFDGAAYGLESLHRRVPLLERGPRGEYRLHEIFREFILERHADPSEHANIVDSLARAYAEIGMISKALALAVRGEAWRLVISFLADYGTVLLEGGERSAIVNAMALIPRMLRHEPAVVALHGLLLAVDGKAGPVEAEMRAVLADAELPARLRAQLRMRLAELIVNRGAGEDGLALIEEGLIEGPPSDDDHLELVATGAAAAAASGNIPKTLEFIGLAETYLPRARVELRGRALVRLSFASLYIGDYGGAETRALSALEIADTIRVPGLAARAYSTLQGVASMIYPDTALTKQYAQGWADSGREAGERSTQALGLIALLAVCADRGDDDEFDAALVELRALRSAPSARHRVPLVEARVTRDIGRSRFREAALAITSLDTSDCLPSQRAFCDALLAVVSAAADQRQRAQDLLQTPALALAADDLESRRYYAYAHAYRAMAQWLLGRAKVAQRSLSFDTRDLPERDILILNVLRSICASPRAAMNHTNLGLLVGPLVHYQMGGYARFLTTLFRPVLMTTTLTRSELDVLRELHRGRKPAEIAASLGRAPKTIYSHIHSACSKLELSGADAAVKYAVGQGWLD